MDMKERLQELAEARQKPDRGIRRPGQAERSARGIPWKKR